MLSLDLLGDQQVKSSLSGFLVELCDLRLGYPSDLHDFSIRLTFFSQDENLNLICNSVVLELQHFVLLVGGEADDGQAR